MGAFCSKPEEINFGGPVDLWHFYLLRSVGKAVPDIIQERRLLEEIHPPFVCNLAYAFQDDDNLGLGSYARWRFKLNLDRAGFLKEEVVKFYVCEMVLALGYLHLKGIVHRDLKLNNILLDKRAAGSMAFMAPEILGKRGYTSTIDWWSLGVVTFELVFGKPAGSMAFMAPEILGKRGYTSTIDWWSLGVVTFELVFGKRPFRVKTNSTLTTAISREESRFPETLPQVIGPEALNFFKKVLDVRDGGIEKFKSHNWFRGLDWDGINSLQATPPFEPDPK
ncbi:uncharacterized protein MELLADRAFT_105522 [Melampsora larici-populina 98AG31]|uniref:Protein kinase domain-containing protein n=1 Tax=Melampsora larici-populina (strain 98AG31 / pathotype 3-4-7) TaxID=747676 RepID=F4RIH5_MELLP|nr:uncharacterized protein MELLADRAFT_105522 [Melampsora larici-populina 98AG31]EGG07566.1 hypothetical protein MELLADRAFT_105522 [Melampsora larici-populina 98AG31]